MFDHDPRVQVLSDTISKRTTVVRATG